MSKLPEAKSWTVAWTTYRNRRCDRCRRLRPTALYMEMYGDEDWWFECAHCAIKSIAKMNDFAYGPPKEGPLTNANA